MGYFDSGVAASLPPLTSERVQSALSALDWNFRIDEDGDIGGGWEFGTFFFFLNGESDELLCVRGFWRGRLEPVDWLTALELCNEWNAEKIWPKAYAARDEEGYVRLNVEVNVDYEHGLTDEQLAQHLVCAVNTGMSFFEHLNARFPLIWEQYKPED